MARCPKASSACSLRNLTALESVHPLAHSWLNGARCMTSGLSQAFDGYFAAPRRFSLPPAPLTTNAKESRMSGIAAPLAPRCAAEERIRDGRMGLGRRVRASSTSGDECGTDDEANCSKSSTPIASCSPSGEISCMLTKAQISEKAAAEPVAAVTILPPHDLSVMPKEAGLLQHRVNAAYALRDAALDDDDNWMARFHEVEAETVHKELLQVVRRIVPARRIVGFEVA